MEADVRSTDVFVKQSGRWQCAFSQLTRFAKKFRGNLSEPKSKKSKAPVAMAPLLAKYLRAWQKETAYAKATDWVFASDKTHGRTPA